MKKKGKKKKKPRSCQNGYLWEKRGQIIIIPSMCTYVYYHKHTIILL